jgi:hypothetical protein
MTFDKSITILPNPFQTLLFCHLFLNSADLKKNLEKTPLA